MCIRDRGAGGTRGDVPGIGAVIPEQVGENTVAGRQIDQLKFKTDNTAGDVYKRQLRRRVSGTGPTQGQ